jgi:hypothetical protein
VVGTPPEVGIAGDLAPVVDRYYVVSGVRDTNPMQET